MLRYDNLKTALETYYRTVNEWDQQTLKVVRVDPKPVLWINSGLFNLSNLVIENHYNFS